MNIFKKIIFLMVCLIFLTSFRVHAQTALGIRYEPFYFYSEQLNQTRSEFSSNSLYFIVGHQFNKNILIELQQGFILVKNIYGGFETGVATKYFPGENKYFLMLGLLVNFQIGKLTDSEGFDKTHYLASLGFGAYFDRIILIQFSYQFPIANNIIDETSVWNPYDFTLNEHIKSKLKGMIKLGIGVSFDL